MDEDFNTPRALAVLFDLASELNRTRSAATAALLRQLGGVLGVLQQTPSAYLQGGLDASRIEAAIAERSAAKASRNYADADRIRKELAAQGVELKDGPHGTTWVKA
jgi:cysteinyl-tRNA synthetase